MSFDYLFRRLRRRQAGSARRTRTSAPRARLLVEPLESRLTPASLPGGSFDFGTAISPLAEGHIQETGQVYSDARGYGWRDTNGLTSFAYNSHFWPDPLTVDGVRSASRAFLVNLPNRTFRVSLTLGELGATRDNIAVYAQGYLVASNITTSGTQFRTINFNVAVTTGQLVLRFADQGGTNNLFSLNGLSLTRIVGPSMTLNAGPDQRGNEGSVIGFQGSSDPIGLNYEWDFGDGSPKLTNTLNPAHIYADNGSYTLTLTGTDGLGRTASDTAIVTVDNVKPTATLGAASPVSEASPTTISFTSQLDPSSADTAAGFKYSYDLNGDGAWDLVDVAQASAQTTFADNGTFTLRGRIKDKDGGFTNYTTTLVVNNVAPTATLGNNGPVSAGSPVTLNFANQNDPSGPDTAAGFKYSYDFNNDGTYDIVDSTSSTATHTFNAAGSYVVKGKIADKDGGFTTYATTVAVTDSSPPTVNAGADQQANEGASITFQGSSTPAGLSYLWDFGDGSTTSGTLTPSHAYADNGTYTVTLTGTDAIGQSASDTAIVTVANVAPTATLANNGPKAEGSAVTISFTNQQDPSSADTTAGFKYSYDFNNDGTFDLVDVTQASAQSTFADNGNYTVKGRIKDKNGGFTDYTTTVVVTNVAPTASFGNNGPVSAGSPVTFTFSNRSDPSGPDTTAGFKHSYDFNNDGIYDVVDSTSPTATYTFTAPGSYIVKGKIADKDGGSNVYSTTVNVGGILRTFFVSGTGSDSNNGSSASPWRTLQYAANQITAGDEIIVRAGNYQGFNLPASGTALNPIVFRAEVGAVVNQPLSFSGNLYGINASGKAYVTIDGFSFTPQSGQGEWYAAIRLGGTPGAWVKGNVIRNNTAQMRVVGQSSTPDKYGIYTSWNDGLLVANNTVTGTYNSLIYTSNSAKNYIIRGNNVSNGGGNGIHNNGDLGAGSPGIIYNALIENNIIYNVGFGIGGQAISCDGVQDSRIQNNLLYDIHAKGISLYATNAAEGSKRVIVINNTIVLASDAYVAIRMNEYSSDNAFYNNICVAANANQAWVDIEESSAIGSTFDYNVTTGIELVGGVPRSDWESQYGFDTHSLVSNPTALFVNPAAKDFHLKAGSPAINRGTALNAPLFDIEGRARPNGGAFDIGAYEA